MKIIVTGAAGFIGMHVAEKLLKRGDEVFGLDNLSDYYDVSLKNARINQLSTYSNFRFEKMDISLAENLNLIFKMAKPDAVIHLAAQAGVRYSLQNPQAYLSSNLQGFLNILESCKDYQVGHLVFASSSSVYGSNTNLPFTEGQNVDHPLSFYAATKKSNELMAHSYSHLYKLPITGLRFFTAYGPWGRPDMALFLFTKAILEGSSIDLFNKGNMKRDFTYIDDISESIVRVLDKPATPASTFDSRYPHPVISDAPYRIFNVGNSGPSTLIEYIEALESALNKKAIKNFLPIQPGEVLNTASDNSALQQWISFKPNTVLQQGINNFVDWFRSYYQL